MGQNKDNKKLFEGFPPISSEQWMDKINVDLKGADFTKKLVWQNENKFAVNPYYRAEDQAELDYLNVEAGNFPFVRSTKENNDWEIRQKIYTTDATEANELALYAINRGATALSFDASKLEDTASLTALLQGINLEEIAIHFRSSKDYTVFAGLLIEFVKTTGFDAQKIKGSFSFDSLGYRVLHGAYYGTFDSNMNQLKELMDTMRAELPCFSTLSINGIHFNNAGATIAQELAFSLSSASEYLHQMAERGIKADDILPRMSFNLGIGSSYFMEIAKFRVARMLWARIAEAHGASKELCKAYIHAVTSNWNKSLYDPYVNMLRTTTESMSAAIAGVDAMTVLPFDNTYNTETEFASRVARNQQIIIKEEAHLGKVVDAAAGSYYIEHLTDAIAEAAWDIFLKMEDLGGFAAATEAGFIQTEIEASTKKRDLDIATCKINILGTNQFPNQEERMLDKIEREVKSDYDGIRRYRASEAFEKLRLNTEIHTSKGGKRPVVFLLTYGNLAMRKARASFVANFFAGAGYEIIDNAGFETPELGAKAAMVAKADIVVLCSADDEYLGLANKVNDYFTHEDFKTNLLVAGYPKEDMESLKGIGVADFIHVKSNMLETLQAYNQILGIV